MMPLRFVVIAALLICFSSLAHAQTVVCPITPAAATSNTDCANTAFVHKALAAETVQRAISAAGNITSSDCNHSVAASGGTFYAIGQTGSFTDGCIAWIVNTDPMPTGANSTGAKFVNFVSCNPAETGTYLWPQQSMAVIRANGAWVPLCPMLWEMPTGAFTLNVDPTNGSDTWGVADGLATSGRAFKSVDQTFFVAVEGMRQNFISQTQLNITLCAGCTDSTDIHISSHGGAPLGAQGGDGTIINCNSGTLSGHVDLFFQSTVGFSGCTITLEISATYGASIQLAGHTNTLSGATMTLSKGGTVRCDANCTLNVTGTFVQMFLLTSAGSINGVIINQTGNVTYSDAAFRVQSGSFASVQSWTTNGHTATGQKYQVLECASIEGSATIPGSIAGTGSACSEIN